MILHKSHVLVITTLVALQTCMNFSTADISRGQNSSKTGSLDGNIRIRSHLSKMIDIKTQSDESETQGNNINDNASTPHVLQDENNSKKEGQGENIITPAKLQDTRDSNQKTKDYKDDVKPGTFEDFIDTNLKTIMIGIIVVVAVIIITLVCCCVCCAATVCNRSTKRRDTQSKQDVHFSKEQDYDHETTSYVQIYSPKAPWKSQNETP